MVIDFESGWYFLVERHVIEAVRDGVFEWMILERHVIEAVSNGESGWYFLVERHVIEAVRV